MAQNKKVLYGVGILGLLYVAYTFATGKSIFGGPAHTYIPPGGTSGGYNNTTGAGVWVNAAGQIANAAGSILGTIQRWTAPGTGSNTGVFANGQPFNDNLPAPTNADLALTYGADTANWPTPFSSPPVDTTISDGTDTTDTSGSFDPSGLAGVHGRGFVNVVETGPDVLTMILAPSGTGSYPSGFKPNKPQRSICGV